MCINFTNVSMIFLLDFGTVLIVWYFFLFNILPICPFYSYSTRGHVDGYIRYNLETSYTSDDARQI